MEWIWTAVPVQLDRIAHGRARDQDSTSWSDMWCLIYQEAERRHLPPDSVSPFPLRPHPRARQVPPPREGPARTGEGARRPIQAPPTHLPRVRGAPSPSPQQSLQPPTVSPTTPSAGGPNWEDRSNHQNPLHGHSRRPPPSYGAAAAGAMLPPLVVSAVRACAAPAGPAPAPGWGPCVLSRWGGAMRATAVRCRPSPLGLAPHQPTTPRRQSTRRRSSGRVYVRA